MQEGHNSDRPFLFRELMNCIKMSDDEALKASHPKSQGNQGLKNKLESLRQMYDETESKARKPKKKQTLQNDNNQSESNINNRSVQSHNILKYHSNKHNFYRSTPGAASLSSPLDQDTIIHSPSNSLSYTQNIDDDSTIASSPSLIRMNIPKVTKNKSPLNNKITRPRLPPPQPSIKEEDRASSQGSKLRQKMGLTPNKTSNLSKTLPNEFSFTSSPVGKYRPAHNKDPSLISIGVLDEAAIRLGLGQSGPGDGQLGGDGVDISLLQQRIRQLESQNDMLQDKLDQKDTLLIHAESQIVKYTHDIDKLKRQHQEAIHKLQEQHKITISKLKDEYTTDNASVTSLNTYTTTTAAGTGTNAGLTKLPVIDKLPLTLPLGQTQSNSQIAILPQFNSTHFGEGKDLSDINKDLIKQIELLQTHEQSMYNTYKTEKKQLIIEHNNKINTLESEYKTDILSLKHKLSLYEDTMLSKDESLSTLASKLDAANRLNTQLVVYKEEAVQAQLRIQDELIALRQALSTHVPPHILALLPTKAPLSPSPPTQTGPTIQISHNSTSGASVTHATSAAVPTSVSVNHPPEIVTRLIEAKEESKIKHLNNKIEFLKSQLETEQNTIDDLKQTLTLSHTKINEIKYEHRLKLQECEVLRKNMVEECEKRIESIYEEKAVEIGVLQTKTGVLDQQLSEARQVGYIR